MAFKATMTLEHIINGSSVGTTMPPQRVSPVLAPAKAREGQNRSRSRARTESRRKKDFFIQTRIDCFIQLYEEAWLI